jgi:hypothetical protein
VAGRLSMEGLRDLLSVTVPDLPTAVAPELEIVIPTLFCTPALDTVSVARAAVVGVLRRLTTRVDVLKDDAGREASAAEDELNLATVPVTPFMADALVGLAGRLEDILVGLAGRLEDVLIGLDGRLEDTLVGLAGRLAGFGLAREMFDSTL